MNSNNDSTSKRVIELRKRLAWTQKKLASRLKIDAITVSRWERGTQKPGEVLLRRISRLERKLDGKSRD